jgi:hypothetical protein
MHPRQHVGVIAMKRGDYGPPLTRRIAVIALRECRLAKSDNVLPAW